MIAALELMAAVQAVACCEQELDVVRTFIFVDNEAARANLISMNSPVPVQSELLREMFSVVSKRSMYLWVSRVPSLSNPADEPSRLEASSLVRQGFTQVSPSWQMVRKESSMM